MAQWKGMNSRQQLPTNSLGNDATAQIYLSPTLMLFWVVLSCCFIPNIPNILPTVVPISSRVGCPFPSARGAVCDRNLWRSQHLAHDGRLHTLTHLALWLRGQPIPNFHGENWEMMRVTSRRFWEPSKDVRFSRNQLLRESHLEVS